MGRWADEWMAGGSGMRKELVGVWERERELGCLLMDPVFCGSVCPSARET